MSVISVLNFECQHRFQGYPSVIQAVAISPDQKTIAAAGTGGVNHSHNRWSLWLWNLPDWSLKDVARVTSWDTHQNHINSLAFSISGQFICAGSSDQTSQYHNYPSLSCWEVNSIPSHSCYKPEVYGTLVVASHPQESIFATIHGSGQVKLWQHPGGGLLTQTHEWEAHSGPSYTMLFSPDGRWLCTGGNDGEIKIWDVKTGKYSRSLLGHKNTVRSLAFSPDGSLLISGSDQRIKIWNFETGEMRQSFFGHPDWIRGLTVTTDSQFLLSTGDTKIKIWNLETAQKLQTFIAHDAPIRAMTMSQDGKLLITGSTDGVVKVWQLT